MACNDPAGETQALEIQNSITSEIYADSGDNPMTYDEFITYNSTVRPWLSLFCAGKEAPLVVDPFSRA